LGSVIFRSPGGSLGETIALRRRDCQLAGEGQATEAANDLASLWRD
jgi:hypothetical protein